MLLEKGNIKEDDWKDKNKIIFLINDCIIKILKIIIIYLEIQMI